MKIIDCFTFLNELELLELRLIELGNTVDHFVLVEANRTFAGNPKPWIFEKHKERFWLWLNKIIYVQVDDMPDQSAEDVWRPERHQRNAIMRGLEQVAEAGDRVLIGDVDEIPSPEAIRANAGRLETVVFLQELFYYYVNCRCRRNWRGTIMATYGSFPTAQRVRDLTGKRGGNVYPRGGWHYSYLTGYDPERIAYKVQNVTEWYRANIVGGTEEIAQRVRERQDIWGRDGDWRMKMRIVDLGDDKPRALDGWLQKYPQFYAGGAHG